MNEELIKRIEAVNEQAQSNIAKNDDRSFQQVQTKAIIEMLEVVGRALIESSDKRTSKVEEVNPVKEVKTPDVEKVVDKLETLTLATMGNKPISNENLETKLSELVGAINELPKTFPTMPEFPEIPAQLNFEPTLRELIRAVKDKEMAPVFDPQITVKASDVKMDMQGVEERLERVGDKLETLRPVPTDFEPIELHLEKMTDLLEASANRPIPISGGSGTTFNDSSGDPTKAQLTTDGNVPVASGNLLDGIDYDYMSLTYVASGNGAGEVETVTYKEGGSGGTTVATLTLTYNASDEVATVART